MTTIRINTSSYNARRYSKPWIAQVTFPNPKGEYAWGNWVGQVNGGNGSEGTLVITVNDGDIVARGQKDFRGSNGETNYYQVRNGELAYLEGGKAEAYRLATEMVSPTLGEIILDTNDIKVGTKVIKDGYEGTVTRICERDNSLVDISMDRGTVSVEKNTFDGRYQNCYIVEL